MLGTFLTELLAAVDIVKIGLGLTQDISRLAASYPHLFPTLALSTPLSNGEEPICENSQTWQSSTGLEDNAGKTVGQQSRQGGDLWS